MKCNKISVFSDAILNNLSVIANHAKGVNILPMLKANAYGHGILEVARVLEGHVKAVAVARSAEALLLLKAKRSLDVVLMSGVTTLDEFRTLVAHGCQVTIASQPMLEKILMAEMTGKTTIWLKFNTGMNRLGLPIEQAEQIITQLRHCSWVDAIRLMSHLSDADLANNDKTIRQINTLKAIGQAHRLPTSLANSAAIIQYPEAHCDWVRPGIMLYGASPISTQSASALGLQPAMALHSYIFDIRTLKKGEQVGYGSTWQSDKEAVIGVIAIGYGDGYPRGIKEGTPVWINGVLYPIVGRVSMDLITVNLTGARQVKIGDSVEMWGANLPINVIAEYANTIPYEILTRVAPRLTVTELREAHDEASSP